MTVFHNYNTRGAGILPLLAKRVGWVDMNGICKFSSVAYK